MVAVCQPDTHVAVSQVQEMCITLTPEQEKWRQKCRHRTKADGVVLFLTRVDVLTVTLNMNAK